MDPVASIRRLGFRKWYERQLIDCHAALVTCLLCGVTVAALLESIAFTRLSGADLSKIAIIFAAAAVGRMAWGRYITVLERAERYGQRSSCEVCSTYGRFDVTHSGVDTVPGPTAKAVAPLKVAWMRVKCRKCGATWRMPD